MNQPLKNPVAAALGVAVQGLKEDRAPTSIGYNDFALMFALTQEQLPGKPISAEYLSKYLRQHPAVPEDARLEPNGVEAYLKRLEGGGLITRMVNDGYTMHDELVRLLSANVGRVKTPDLDELAIRGVSLYSARDSPLYKK